jgi:hypothetical protein
MAAIILVNQSALNIGQYALQGCHGLIDAGAFHGQIVRAYPVGYGGEIPAYCFDVVS